MIIKHLTNDQIDKNKWDDLVKKYSNDRMYLLSSYLDAVCNNWEALVIGDFEAIMPLPIKRIFGVYKRHYIPLYIQQLGIVGLQKSQSQIFNSFLKKAMSLHFNFIHPLNHENGEFNTSIYKTQLRTNYELDLNNDYQVIRKRYSDHLNRNIQKANSEKLEFNDNENWSMLQQYILQYSNPNDPSPKKIDTIYQINQINYPEFESNIYSVSLNEEVLAVCFAPRFQSRITLLIPRSSPIGRIKNAMAFMIDRIIESHAGKEMVLDFEGSMLPGVAKFYRQFGTVNRSYNIISK